MKETPIQDRRDLASHQTRTSLSHGVMPTWLGVTLAVAYAANVFAGVIYWAVNGWLAGVLLSALVPGFGVVSIVVSLLS